MQTPTISVLIQNHRSDNLPTDVYNKICIIVRRKHVFSDTMHQLRCGLDVLKHMRVTFVGEPAVDAGGPMREYLHISMASVARNNSLFCGEETGRVPVHSVVELERKRFFYVGTIYCTLSHPWRS